MDEKEVLILEDDPRFRRVIKNAFAGETYNGPNYKFHEAESILEGTKRLTECPNIRVILLDLKLPDGSGGDFLEQIKGSINRYRVIVLTAHDEKLGAEMAREYGVFNYLPKATGSFTQSIRFSLGQSFRDIETEQLKDKNKVLIEIQKKITSEIQESTTAGRTLEALNDVLKVVCQSVRSLVGAYTCHIRVYNLNQGDFDLAAFDGPSDVMRTIFATPRSKGELFSGKVASAKTPLLFDDLQNDEEFNVFRAQSFKRLDLLENDQLVKEAEEYFNTIQSAFIAPITTRIFDDETDAIFNVSGDSVEFFSEEKQEVIKEFVTQATIAITKAWQKRRKEESHQDYKGISKVLEDISKELRGEDVKTKIYDIAIKGISDIIKPETVSIFLYNKTTRLLDNEAEFRGHSKVEPRKVGHPTDLGLTGWVYSKGKSLRIPNLQKRDRSKPLDHDEYSKDLELDYIGDIPSGRVDHYLGVPMIIGDEVVGAIQLLNKKSGYYSNPQIDKERWLLERGFSDDCENVLWIAAGYLAVALKNAELLEERNRTISQLDTLKDVGRYTSTEMPLDELLNKIIEEAAKDVQAEICLLFLLDGSKSKVVLEQCYGIPKAIIEGASYEIAQGLTGSVASTGRSELQKADYPKGRYDENIKNHLQRTYGENATIESLMVVPIKAKGEILGVIKAINKKGDDGQYNEEDLSFFETFASYVGIAIENAQRYTLTNEKLAIAEKNVALSHLVQAVVHEINNKKALIPINVQLIRDRVSRSIYDINGMLDIIKDSADKAVAFANSIQAFSASRLGKREPQEINRIIKQAIQQLAPDLQSEKEYKAIKLEEKLSNEPLECSVYETPFEQVVQNIILNAYQAMVESEKQLLTITSYKDSENNLAKIEFTDTGHGIKSEILEKIFDPEYTSKGAKGTGIGLWLAKTHLDSIDAEIKVKSVLNEGTTFTIEIPISGMSTSE